MIKITEACINLIKEFEAFSSKPYHGEKDPLNVFTIGYGTITYPNGIRVSLSDTPITEAQALQYLTFYLNNEANIIDHFLRDDLSDNQFASLLSFSYNLGWPNLRSSTLLRKVNANPQDTEIRTEFMKWVHSDGEIVAGLIRRRGIEADLYFTL